MAATRKRKAGSIDAGKASWAECACDRDEFVNLVVVQGDSLYRDLPWRNIDDPYAVLVSEVMLQQTQVARVVNYWQRWMNMFPTVDSVAAADTSDVLEAWQGLGYNRRALALKRACAQCSETNGGRLPETAAELVELPGIGPATAGGIVAFAFDKPALYLETNVRSVFLHELFPDREGVSDKEIEPFVADTCPNTGVRSWYYALLDYGAHLKATGVNPSRRSKHYARQSAFAGSHREKRSFVLKQVLSSPEGISGADLYESYEQFELHSQRHADAAEYRKVLDELLKEGFFRIEGEVLKP